MTKDDFTIKKATSPQSRFKNQDVEPEFWRQKKIRGNEQNRVGAFM